MSRLAEQSGAIALTGVVTGFLLLGLLIPVLLGVIDVLGTHQRAQVAADAAALALIGESPVGRLPRLLIEGTPPAATADRTPEAHDPDLAAQDRAPAVAPTPSTPVHDLSFPSPAALALARQVSTSNGARLVEIDAAGWPNEILITVHAAPAGPAARLWDGTEVRAAAALRRDD